MRLHGPVGYIAPRSTVALAHLRGNHGGSPHSASFAGGFVCSCLGDWALWIFNRTAKKNNLGLFLMPIECKDRVNNYKTAYMLNS